VAFNRKRFGAANGNSDKGNPKPSLRSGRSRQKRK
jgi:hypothetical protein